MSNKSREHARRSKLEKRIQRRIRNSRKGKVFCTDNFSDLGDIYAVEAILSELVEQGTIRRLSRSLFDFPEQHPLHGYIDPTPIAIAEAIAGSNNLRLIDVGLNPNDIAAISTTVPKNVTYSTNGVSQTVEVSDLVIVLIDAASDDIAGKSTIPDDIVTALHNLGEEEYTINTFIRNLRTLLTVRDKALILDRISSAPSWMHGTLQEIARV